MALQGGGSCKKGKRVPTGSLKGWEGGFAGWVGSYRWETARGGFSSRVAGILQQLDVGNSGLRHQKWMLGYDKSRGIATQAYQNPRGEGKKV